MKGLFRGETRVRDLIFLFILFLGIPAGVILVGQRLGLFTRAGGETANLLIDASSSFSVPFDEWKHLSQGGEEQNGQMLTPVLNETKALSPTYIRLDHLYDFYQIVSRDSAGNLAFDWTRLDKVVDEVTSTGAKPFLSLSYMPSAISSGKEIDNPTNWNDWKIVVQRTIEHYSGRSGKAIADVYYEVWNEPDLFGSYKTYGGKNYLELYRYSAFGARDAQNTLSFKFGGPATTALYKNWVQSLAKLTSENNLRFDFLSWHRYDKDPNVFETDITNARIWLSDFPQYQQIEFAITEAGFDSNVNKGYDETYSAIHTLATIAAVDSENTRVFSFEVKDGPGPEKKWGRWGVLTHEKYGTPEKKPRYNALLFANNLKGGRVNIAGEGSWVKALGRNDGTLRLLVVNFDPHGRHVETVPMTFINLPTGNFILRRTDLFGKVTNTPVATDSATFATKQFMSANSASIFEIIPR